MCVRVSSFLFRALFEITSNTIHKLFFIVWKIELVPHSINKLTFNSSEFQIQKPWENRQGSSRQLHIYTLYSRSYFSFSLKATYIQLFQFFLLFSLSINVCRIMCISFSSRFVVKFPWWEIRATRCMQNVNCCEKYDSWCVWMGKVVVMMVQFRRNGIGFECCHTLEIFSSRVFCKSTKLPLKSKWRNCELQNECDGVRNFTTTFMSAWRIANNNILLVVRHIA